MGGQSKQMILFFVPPSRRREALDHKGQRESDVYTPPPGSSQSLPPYQTKKNNRGVGNRGLVGTLTSNFKRGLGLYLPDKNNPK